MNTTKIPTVPSWRNRHFFCRCVNASSNNMRMTLPRVLRSSSASLSISLSKFTGSRTETPTDSGSSLIFAISTRREGYRDVTFCVNRVTYGYLQSSCNHYDYIVIFNHGAAL
jgi:hypothetical protein